MKTLVSIVLILAIMMTGEVWAGSALNNSCKNLSLQGSPQGPALRAECKKNNETYHISQISLDPLIGNKNGALRWNSSNFSHTCRNLSLDGTRLKAECMDWYRKFVPAEINLNDNIMNDNGSLIKGASPHFQPG